MRQSRLGKAKQQGIAMTLILFGILGLFFGIVCLCSESYTKIEKVAKNNTAFNSTAGGVVTTTNLPEIDNGVVTIGDERKTAGLISAAVLND